MNNGIRYILRIPLSVILNPIFTLLIAFSFMYFVSPPQNLNGRSMFDAIMSLVFIISIFTGFLNGFFVGLIPYKLVNNLKMTISLSLVVAFIVALFLSMIFLIPSNDNLPLVEKFYMGIYFIFVFGILNFFTNFITFNILNFLLSDKDEVN